MRPAGRFGATFLVFVLFVHVKKEGSLARRRVHRAWGRVHRGFELSGVNRVQSYDPCRQGLTLTVEKDVGGVPLHQEASLQRGIFTYLIQMKKQVIILRTVVSEAFVP